MDHVKLYMDKELDLPKIADFPVDTIDFNNVILYKLTSYYDDVAKKNRQYFNSGLIYDKGQYYFFFRIPILNNILLLNQNHERYGYSKSYYLYPLSSKNANKMIGQKTFGRWEAHFNALYDYKRIYILVLDRHSKVSKKGLYRSINNHDGNLYIPSIISPLGFKNGITYGEFIKKHKSPFINNYKTFDVNEALMREIKINKLIE